MEKKQIKIIISNYLKRLGVATDVHGYYYIMSGILLLIEDMSLIGKLTTKLYPEIAKEFGTTPSKVERAIRHAIERGFERADTEVITKVFGYSYSKDRGKATNSEFLTTVADYIKIVHEV